MYHTLAYTTAIGAVANTDVPALSDDIIQIQNNHFILPSPMQLFLAAVFSPTAINAQLVSPTVRQINPTFFRPVNLSALPGNNTGLAYQYQGGVRLSPFEEIQVLGTAAPGTTERFTALLWAGDQVTPPPMGSVYVCQWTSTGTAVVNAWTSIAMALTNVLPSGIYTMIQSEHWSTNAIAHRWIFSGQSWRPGHISMTGPGNRQPDQEQVNWLGTMGTFRSNDLPRLQVLCNVADAVHTGTMFLIRTGNLAG